MSEESLGPHRGKVLNTGNLIKLVSQVGEGCRCLEQTDHLPPPHTHTRSSSLDKAIFSSAAVGLLHRAGRDRLLVSLNSICCWSFPVLPGLLHKLLEDYVLRAYRSSIGELRVSKTLGFLHILDSRKALPFLLLSPPPTSMDCLFPF